MGLTIQSKGKCTKHVKKSAGRVEWVERVDMFGVTEEDVRGRVRRMKMVGAEKKNS